MKIEGKYTFFTSFTEMEKFAHTEDEEEEISAQEDRDCSLKIHYGLYGL